MFRWAIYPDKDEPEDRPGAVYNIKCSDRQATYIGENTND